MPPASKAKLRAWILSYTEKSFLEAHMAERVPLSDRDPERTLPIEKTEQVFRQKQVRVYLEAFDDPAVSEAWRALVRPAARGAAPLAWQDAYSRDTILCRLRAFNQVFPDESLVEDPTPGNPNPYAIHF